ncbi:L-serine ammonia-lyase, iron-sulfur-dependent, subunit alpha [Desulfovibrio sp. OttesenSCG-928-C06]|nr:L-serine ammonia-lyase, iron-sulfur-dependent, subunit alpha [Desulfovibrio sp. OttesenSCG-928-C06]
MNYQPHALLTGILKADMKPALGVTEPGAIAFAVSRARSLVNGEIVQVTLRLNSGMYKNAFTCGIPNSDKFGNAFAAALGAVGANPDAGLESLSAITAEHNRLAQALLDAGKIKVELSGITPDIFIQATVETESGSCTVTIEHGHTDITSITLNGETVLSAPPQREKGEETGIHAFGLEQLLEFVNTVEEDSLTLMMEAYTVNLALLQASLDSPRTVFTKVLYQENGQRLISVNELATAQLMCNGAIEARVIGLDKPAMSITGSGAHGIICTMPLYAFCKVRGLSQEKLLRATALSYLVTMYIKEYSGRLSAFCGCAIAAGTGMACALAWLHGAGYEQICGVISNMASSITGMICDGGNQGCTMKGIVAVDAAFRSVDLAMSGASVDVIHGINGRTPEDTMRHMGLIASPGMTATEGTILEIMQKKNAG